MACAGVNEKGVHSSAPFDQKPPGYSEDADLDSSIRSCCALCSASQGVTCVGVIYHNAGGTPQEGAKSGNS